MVSLRGFVKTINTQRPDLTDPNVKLIYEATKLKHKPGKSTRNPREELKPLEGGWYELLVLQNTSLDNW